MYISAIVLAGGLGQRMKSPKPKVLHLVAGVPMLECVLVTLSKLNVDEILVVGSDCLFSCETWTTFSEQILSSMKNVKIISQDRPRGTGHAVQTAVRYLNKNTGKVIICNADTPLIRKETFQQLLMDGNDLSLLIMPIDDPEKSLYGRVICNRKSPIQIIETKDASPEQKKINIANTGVYGISIKCLLNTIYKLDDKNTAQEFYLTDLVRLAYSGGYSTNSWEISKEEGYGIDTLEALQNNPSQKILIENAIKQGVFFQDPKNVFLSFDTEIGKDCKIGAFNVFGPNVVLGGKVTVLPFCYLENCTIQSGCTIGPFARIKEKSFIASDSVIGNFVEVKKSKIGTQTKVKHLSYVGDATIGNAVNIGAGAIFCNYDGFQKHSAFVDDNAKIGANVSLIAPVAVGKSAFIGAGSVITKDVPEETLAIARTEQQLNYHWVKRKMSRFKPK